MIAAAIKSTAASPTSLSWFDVVLVLVLAFGLFRGRRNGMGRELVPTLMWITLVVVSGLGYSMAGQVFVNAAGMGKTLSYILAYVILAFVVYLIFSLINRAVTAKLAASNTFGSGEYYLGMPAGMIRFACILLALLALLNAPSYSAADAAAHKAYVAQTYGGGESGFSGDFFPSLQSIQEQVFKTSLTGPYIKTYCDPLLINVGPPDVKGLKPGVPPPKHPVIHMGN